MATFQGTLAVGGEDDGYVTPGGGGRDSSDVELYFGNIGVPIDTFLRYTEVTIPHGATINSAQLSGFRNGANGSAVSIRVDALAEADATVPISDPDYVSRIHTTANADSSFAAGGAGAAFTISNLAAILQEVIELPEWSMGAIVICIKNREATGYAAVASVENPTYEAITLTVDYTVPGIIVVNKKLKVLLNKLSLMRSR